MKQELFEVTENLYIAPGVLRMRLLGNVSEITRPGQFVNIKAEGFYLRRPISVCDIEPGQLTLIYKVVGRGTDWLRRQAPGTFLDLLVGLGNGYDTSFAGKSPLVIGGGVGVPPMYYLAKRLVAEGREVHAILGFNKREEIFLTREFEELGVHTIVATADGSCGVQGFVTDAMRIMENEYSYFYACGPELMLKAVCKASKTEGQLSFERRMGCGFGACMGCSCKTLTGYKRICKEGPVMKKEEILWED